MEFRSSVNQIVRSDCSLATVDAGNMRHSLEYMWCGTSSIHAYKYPATAPEAKFAKPIPDAFQQGPRIPQAPGGCMPKAYWIQRQTIPGVYLIAVDRAG